MSAGAKLINKMGRLERAVRRLAPDYEKINKQEEVMPEGVKRLVEAEQHRLDLKFGHDETARKIKIAELLLLAKLERFDFGLSGHDLRATIQQAGLPEITLVDTLADVQGVAERSTVQTIADTGALEATDITAVADVAGSLNSTYFNFSDALDAHKYYVWYNINSAGVDPAVPGRTGIEVDAATGASANTVASASRAAITAAAGSFVTVSGSTSHIIITNKKLGNSTDTADGTAATGFTFNKTANGAASNLQNKYFVINSALNAVSYYVWMNVNSEGVDPAPAGKTGIEVDIAAGASANSIASAIQAAVDPSSDFVATVLNDTVTITNAATGATTDSSDAGSTGFTVLTTIQGITAASLSSKYFVLFDRNGSVAVWYKVSGVGSAPVGFGRTVEVDLVNNDSANTVASKTRAVLNADAEMTCAVSNNNLTITSKAYANFRDSFDFNTGFTVSTSQDGKNPLESIGIQPGDLLEILSGTLKGKTLEVSSVSGNYLRLDLDISGYVTENNLEARSLSSTVKPSFS